MEKEDIRLQTLRAEEEAALGALEQEFDGQEARAGALYDAQAQAAKNWTQAQTDQAKAEGQLALEALQQQKHQAAEAHTREQSGAYVDWQKQSGSYGADAEAMADLGMTGSGYSESTQTAMYIAYQNRLAVARQGYQAAVAAFDTAMAQARLQNSALLAQIAFEGLQTQLDIALEGLRYRDDLLAQQNAQRQDIQDRYDRREEALWDRLHKEAALAEEIRQYNESLAEDRRQFNIRYYGNPEGIPRPAPSTGGGGGSKKKKEEPQPEAPTAGETSRKELGLSAAAAAVAGGLAAGTLWQKIAGQIG